MAECANCGEQSGTAKFCGTCVVEINAEAARGLTELTVWLHRWTAWQLWCIEHGQPDH